MIQEKLVQVLKKLSNIYDVINFNQVNILGLTVLAPKVQSFAPDFSGTAVVNKEFKEIKLSDFKGKYVVLFFYPLDL